ncbi:glycine oxidase ThiO [Staphylococcus xylosus]|uniref:NAD(P)/FAD-dependent oxidoreductase n=1 Tax=Staphylococcus xylosus TaxID=1288 RepID=UPI000D1F6BF3|nr:FAD-dependent oxidoreductase [Staphylococcus xylosus]PTI04951.1 glycine oxidase ThiO [Staphylococcus xylosus]
MYDVIIIGSGVMGMSVARELSQFDLDIAVLDRDKSGMHASYKAGGMLGAQNEFTENSSLFDLAMTSQKMFESLKDSLLEEVDMDIEYLNSGLLKLAANDFDNKKIDQQYQFLQQHSASIKYLRPDDVHNITNGAIKTQTSNGIYIPGDHQVNANRYSKALLKSLSRRQIHRMYNTEVLDISAVNGSYRVITQQGTHVSKKVIVTAGAWSRKLLKKYLANDAVIGVKGEVLLVEQPNLSLDITMFLTNGCYIVPKMKGRYLIGATSYFNDYSVGVSNDGKSWLKTQAVNYLPDLKHSKIINQWSGVRPFCKNEQPIMDEVDTNLFLITGHYRNGILLSPYVGMLMSQWIMSGTRPQQLYDFQIQRGESDEM